MNRTLRMYFSNIKNEEDFKGEIIKTFEKCFLGFVDNCAYEFIMNLK